MSCLFSACRRVVSVDKKSVDGLSPHPLGLTQSRVRQIQAIRELAPTKKGRAISSPGVNVIKLFIFVADTGEKWAQSIRPVCILVSLVPVRVVHENDVPILRCKRDDIQLNNT